MQKTIDFSKQLKHHENNTESQEYFENNSKRFSKQCRIIYDALLKGEKLSTKIALLEYGVGDLRRRIKDLKDIYKVNNILDERMTGGFKVWWIKKDSK